MPRTVFLTEKEPLVFKAARWLVENSAGRPLDLSRTIIVLPTSGAMRRLRAELTNVSSAFLPPAMTSPLGLLDLAGRENVASRPEILAAWSHVIGRASAERYPLLLAGFSDPRRSALRIAQSMVDVCTILADAALTPLASEISQACPQDEDRWREVASLYKRYLQRLEKVGLHDPNEVRIATAQSGESPDFDRVIVAGVPDLNGLVAKYLEAIDLQVTVLVDAPDCGEARFDAWGRPDAEDWTHKELPLPVIIPLADPFSEAQTVAGMLGNAALCVADSALLPQHQRALQESGRATFDPAGKPLARFECAAIARLWMLFCRTGRMADLRALAEHPVFLNFLCEETGLAADVVFGALDKISTGVLLKFLPEAVSWFRRSESDEGVLLRAVEGWREEYDTEKGLAQLTQFLDLVYRGHRVLVGSSEAEALEELGKVLRSLMSAGEEAEELFQAEVRATSVYGVHEVGAVELNGWLEVPWLPHEAVVVSGCTEGALPSHVSGHPFLPESLRVALGLPGNSQRLARDVFMMHNLLASRIPEMVRFTLSRTGAEGEPMKPSRLLFRCDEAELPGRVEMLFGPLPSLRQTHARNRAWPLDVPQAELPKYLRVTSFGDYLECPLRFYFRRVLKMERFDAGKAEMDALDFGTILHAAVEEFSKNEEVRDSKDPGVIEKFVLGELDVILAKRFGKELALPVRVQRESLRARLRKFAEIQAAERAAGWKIVGVEVPFVERDTISLAGLPVTAKIDRVEVHEVTGKRRILDYKTYKTAKNHRPEDVHFGRWDGGGKAEAAAVPEGVVSTVEEGVVEAVSAEVEWGGKSRRWAQLQLPLYRALAGHRWPDDAEPPSVAYFLLPEKIEESGIFEFPLDAATYASALDCAAVVAERVKRGIFWPPREVNYESFDDIFLGEDPAKLFSAASVAFLKGK